MPADTRHIDIRTEAGRAELRRRMQYANVAGPSGSYWVDLTRDLLSLVEEQQREIERLKAESAVEIVRPPPLRWDADEATPEKRG